MAKSYTPVKHGKAPISGKGQVNKAPGNAAGDKQQNHVPKIGKPAPGEPGNYSTEQQQQ